MQKAVLAPTDLLAIGATFSGAVCYAEVFPEVVVFTLLQHVFP